MDDFGGDWALFEELGSRVVADLYAENSPRLAESAIRTRAFAAEGAKVVEFTSLVGICFGLDADLPDNATELQLQEAILEEERVYEIQQVLPDGKLLAKVIWPEDKKLDSKAGTSWVVRPDAIPWVYNPQEGTPQANSGWRKQWDALQDSAYARWGD